MNHTSTHPAATSKPSNGVVVVQPAPAAEHALTHPEDTDSEAELAAQLASIPAQSGGLGAPTAPAIVPGPGRPRTRPSLLDRLEAFISRLSTRNNFWHRVCSLVWLPFAFRSGIRMKRIDDTTFDAVLPFRRFNRNWYNAMAGAALLGNAEIAGGMYVFGVCGGDYTVVCKHLEYKFLRPCFGPAVYRLTPREDIQTLMATGAEFNIVIDMDVCQGIAKPKIAGGTGLDKEKRVGRCSATFHVTPKAQQKNKREHNTVTAAPTPATDEPRA